MSNDAILLLMFVFLMIGLYQLVNITADLTAEKVIERLKKEKLL